MNWKSILRFRLIGVILALALSVAIPVGYVAAAEIGSLIKTDDGYVSGTMIGDVGNEVRIFRGIPYAAPPVGDLRWKPPQPVTPWTGIKECTKFGLWAPQTFPTAAWSGNVPESGMGEDCLYLNVLTPAKKTTDRLPVMVWFHGGGLTASSGNMPSYNTQYLPQHGVVLVTVTHRLGAIGYMAHPALTAESPHHASGNYGQLDSIAALKWVKKNIAAFGGDPRRVTIFGQSGGGARVVWLLASPLAKGLFQRAIIEAGIGAGTGGGSAESYYFTTLEAAENSGKALAVKLGVSTLAELRAKKWQDIVVASAATGTGYETRFTVDGWSLPDTAWNIFTNGKKNDVPTMIGAGEPETLKHQGTALWAPGLLNGESNLYVYIFSQVPTNWRNFGLKAYHGLEVSYQFGVIDLIAFHYNALFAAPAGLPKDPGIDWMDRYITDATMTIWAQFAATGDPSVIGLIDWPPFGIQSGQDKYLNIAYPLQVGSDFMKMFK